MQLLLFVGLTLVGQFQYTGGALFCLFIHKNDFSNPFQIRPSKEIFSSLLFFATSAESRVRRGIKTAENRVSGSPTVVSIYRVKGQTPFEVVPASFASTPSHCGAAARSLPSSPHRKGPRFARPLRGAFGVLDDGTRDDGIHGSAGSPALRVLRCGRFVREKRSGDPHTGTPAKAKRTKPRETIRRGYPLPPPKT